MPARIGIERRDSHQAMDAALGLEPAISVLAGDANGRRFDAGAFARALFEPLDLVAVLLAPAHIHAQEHLGPILRLGAARAGMDLEIAIVAVGFAGKEAVELARFDVLMQRSERLLRLVEHRLIAFGLGKLRER